MLKNLFSLSIVIGFFSCENQKEGFVKIRCHYMAYACGGCQPQYKIDSVYETKIFSNEELLNKDIKGVFSNKKLEAELNQQVAKCIICDDFEFEGRLSADLNEYKLYIDSFGTNLRVNCCDE